MSLGDAQKQFEELYNKSDSQLKEATKAGAELLKTYTANTGRSMLRGPYATGQTIASLTCKSPVKDSDGYSCTLTYAGTNRKGNRNGEVAFLNEYGARGHAARPFNRTAITQNESAIRQRMEDTFSKG